MGGRSQVIVVMNGGNDNVNEPLRHCNLLLSILLYAYTAVVTVEEQIVRQLTEKRLKELSTSNANTKKEYQ